MVTSKKVSGKAKGMPIGLLWGVGAGLMVTFFFVAAMTQLILSGTLAETAMGYGTMLALPISTATAAAISYGMIKCRRMQVCLLSGGIYVLCLLMINVLFFGGQFEGIVVTVALSFLGAFIVGMAGIKKEHKKTGKVRKYHHR